MLHKDLQTARNKASTLVPIVCNEIAALLENYIVDNFQNEKYGSNGTKWQNLSTKWKRKDKDYKTADRADRGGILVQSGDLHRDATTVEIINNEVHVGTDLVYGQIHNEGLQGKAFGKHTFTMPQRQFMPIPGEPLPTEIEQAVDKFIEDRLNKIMP